MSRQYSMLDKKNAIFLAIKSAFKMMDEEICPVVVSYQGMAKILEITHISPEIAKNPDVFLDYCGSSTNLESALTRFVFEQLDENYCGFQNEEGGEGCFEFDAIDGAVTCFHSEFERVLTPKEPVKI